MMVYRSIESSQEATKGQQRADEIIQFIWIGDPANKSFAVIFGVDY